MDSYQMLPASLDKLTKSFGVTNKGVFPYNFVNMDRLDYVGSFPEYKYYNGLSPEMYLIFKQEFEDENISFPYWSLRSETIKYCLNDCISLLRRRSYF